jgi:hypothetical protein
LSLPLVKDLLSTAERLPIRVFKTSLPETNCRHWCFGKRTKEARMKRVVLSIITVIAVGGATLFWATPRSAAEPPEPHPEIHAAIHALEHAKNHLEHAAHDFGGHRKEALLATDEAIKQLRICLDYDKE